MKTNMWRLGIIVLALALWVPAGWAQQKDPRVNPPVGPVPPLSPGESSSRGTGETPPGAVPAPASAKSDRQPLTGAAPWTLGERGGGRSFVVPSLNVFLSGDTNARAAGNDSGPETVGQISGRLAGQRIRSRQQMQVDYAGGGQFHSRNSALDSSFHHLGFSLRTQANRWGFLFSDQVSYSTEAGGGLGGFASGLGGAGGLSFLGGISGFGGHVNPALLPSQSVLTTRAPRVSNTVLGEVQYDAGRKSQLTFSGSYGILRFLESGFLDGNTANFSAGYNYALTGRDTVAVSYGAGLLRFENVDQKVNSHSFFVSYGRRITGKLAWQMGAGPQISTFANPVNGSEALVSWGLSTSLLYRAVRSDMQLSYRRGVTGGSGVSVGAETHQVGVGFGRQLSRLWRTRADFGYAHNSRLRQTSATDGVFQTWSAGTYFSRPLGRYARLFFRYGVQRQTTNVPGAAVGLRHTFGVGFDFRFRPIEIE